MLFPVFVFKSASQDFSFHRPYRPNVEVGKNWSFKKERRHNWLTYIRKADII